MAGIDVGQCPNPSQQSQPYKSQGFRVGFYGTVTEQSPLSMQIHFAGYTQSRAIHSVQTDTRRPEQAISTAQSLGLSLHPLGTSQQALRCIMCVCNQTGFCSASSFAQKLSSKKGPTGTESAPCGALGPESSGPDLAGRSSGWQTR